MNAITRNEIAQLDAPVVRFELNGREVQARADHTLIEIADAEGIAIPRLCYKAGLDAVGNCRSCMVEIAGERVLAPSCCRAPTAGMKVTTDSERALKSQKLVLELLLSDMPEAEYTRHNEVDEWAARLGVGKPRFAPRPAVAPDLSHPAMAVNLSACIQCTRCVRACRDEQVNDVIGLAFRGNQAKIVFDMDDPMGASTCVACGECVQACPTGALMPARDVALAVPDKQVASLCPYCGVGCQLTYNVKDNKILFVNGRDGPGQPRAAVRQGPLRLRLRASPATPARAADPARRRAQARRRDDGPRPRPRRLPRGDLGRGARARRRPPGADPRRARPEVARRLRLGQGQQRRGLPVPEAGAHRLSAATTSTTARACATRRASSRCSKASARARSRTR